jgi:AcrR family transcriptional regulator
VSTDEHLPEAADPADPPATARSALLDAAVDHAAHHGVSDLSLRQLAAALGTSHRMLIYHFGSKEGLLTEIVRRVEARQRDQVAALAAATGGGDTAEGSLDVTSPEALATLWAHFADEALWPWERLFFEVYAQALQGRPHARGLLDDAIDAWIDPLADLLVAQGTPPVDARAEARLMLAVTRGLLLDLLATRDRAGVDAAMRRFARLLRPDDRPGIPRPGSSGEEEPGAAAQRGQGHQPEQGDPHRPRHPGEPGQDVGVGG